MSFLKMRRQTLKASKLAEKINFAKPTIASKKTKKDHK